MDKVGPLGGEMIPQGEKQYHLRRTSFETQGDSLKKALHNALVDPASGNRSVSSILVVCALYRSPLSQRVHHTSLIYDVSLSFTRDQFSMIELGSMSADDVISLKPDQVSLHRQEILNGFAD